MKNKIMTRWSRGKKAPKIVLLLGLLIILAGILGVIAAGRETAEKELTYRETIVEFGNLVVGIEESGAVDIGIVEQTFDLDMSALKRVSTSTSGNSAGGSGFGNGAASGGMGAMPGGMSSGMGAGGASGGMGATDMFSQMFNMGGSSTVSTGDSDTKLVVETVNAAVGEQVEAGEVLYTLEAEGVEELRAELESNVSKAKADLDALLADQELSKVTAENTLKTSQAYGDYALTEKNNTISSLEKAVKEQQEALQTARENVTKYQEKLTQAEYDLGLAKEVLDNSIWGREHANGEDIFSVSAAYAQAEEAQSTYDTLEKEKEQARSNLEQALKNVTTCESALAKAERALESGILSAEQTYALRLLAYENVQETYDITVAYLEDDMAEQEEIYAEAKEKWEEFSSHIHGTEILAEYSGVITELGLAAGDSLTTGASIASVYDITEVSMTVSLDEEDMAQIALGGQANISFTAYPEEIYKAEITEISDASSDNSGTTTYDVTVTLQGDVSGLFQGMTGDITFITKENEEVLYVSNRAVFREGIKSYVKVKEADGNIKKVRVTTGFSDGVNVEIVEGLSAGDVVLIESKVEKE